MAAPSIRVFPSSTQPSSSSRRPSLWCASLPRRSARRCVGSRSSALKAKRHAITARSSLGTGAAGLDWLNDKRAVRSRHCGTTRGACRRRQGARGRAPCADRAASHLLGCSGQLGTRASAHRPSRQGTHFPTGAESKTTAPPCSANWACSGAYSGRCLPCSSQGRSESIVHPRGTRAAACEPWYATRSSSAVQIERAGARSGPGRPAGLASVAPSRALRRDAPRRRLRPRHAAAAPALSCWHVCHIK